MAEMRAGVRRWLLSCVLVVLTTHSVYAQGKNKSESLGLRAATQLNERKEPEPAASGFSGYYRDSHPDYRYMPGHDSIQPNQRSCPGKITTVWCWEGARGHLQDIAYWNTDTGSQYLGCSGATLPTAPATRELFLSDNESIVMTETCVGMHGWALESVSFATNKGRTLTCGRGRPSWGLEEPPHDGHASAQAGGTAPSVSQARSLLAAVADLGIAAAEAEAFMLHRSPASGGGTGDNGDDIDAEVAHMPGKGQKHHKTRQGGNNSRKKRRKDKDMYKDDRHKAKNGKKPGYAKPPHYNKPEYPQETDTPYQQRPDRPDHQQPGYGNYPHDQGHRRCQVFKAPKYAFYPLNGMAAGVSPLADFAATCTPERRVASVHSFCFNKGYKPKPPPANSVPVDMVINLGDTTTRPCPTTPQQVQRLYADLEVISQQVRLVSIVPPSQQPIIDRIVWQPFNPALCNTAQQAGIVAQRQLLQLENTTITIQGNFVPAGGFTATDVTAFLGANPSLDLCDLTTAPSVTPSVRVCTGTEFESVPYSLAGLQAVQGSRISLKPAARTGMLSR